MSSSQFQHNSTLARYFSAISHYPPLTRERECKLARNVRTGCKVSRDELVEANLSFVVKVASEYRNLGLPFEDLLNEGNLGLIEAAHRFDATKGTKFITYAIWWIRKSILKALGDRSALVRVPSYQRKQVREIRESEQSLSCSLGRRPNREEISVELDRSVFKIDQALQFNLRGISLDHKVGQEREQPISDYLVDDSRPSAEDDLIRRESNSLVSRAMRELTPQEKAVVCYRFGLRDGYSRTLQEVGSILKISRERVRQVENQAKRRLRRVFSGMRTIRSLPKSPGLHGHTARDGTPGTAPSRALSSNGTKTLVGQ
jgi:RNA polymerase primary sigma factor